MNPFPEDRLVIALRITLDHGIVWKVRTLCQHRSSGTFESWNSNLEPSVQKSCANLLADRSLFVGPLLERTSVDNGVHFFLWHERLVDPPVMHGGCCGIKVYMGVFTWRGGGSKPPDSVRECLTGPTQGP